MLLERQLWPEAFSRQRGGYLERRRIPVADAWALARTSDAIRDEGLTGPDTADRCSEAWPGRPAAHPKHCRDAPGLVPYDAHDGAADLSLFVVHTYSAHDDARVTVR
jgi:hypothetical protein